MKCLICKRDFKIVNNFHLSSAHDISLKQYKEMFPCCERYDKGILDIISKKAYDNNIGKKRSEQTKLAMSVARKKGISEGRIKTPFMLEDKKGKNNPAYGTERRSLENINQTKELLSDIMSNRKWFGNYGVFQSKKMGYGINYRSSYELRFLNSVDVNGCVSEIYFEPCRINYSVDGINHFYVPDFGVMVGSEYFVVEVGTKSFKKYYNQINELKFEAARKFCLDAGKCFSVVTEDELDYLDSVKNRVNCWDDLKLFFHNAEGNFIRDGLKSKQIGKSAAKLLNDQDSMEKVQRLGYDADQQIINPRVPDTKVMI